MSSIRAFFILATALGLVACAATSKPEDDAYVASLPTEQFPLKTVETSEGILLAAHDFGLSQNQAKSLNALASRWLLRREGVVLIEAPMDGGPAVSATAYAARDALESFGVPKASIEVTSYQGEASSNAPIRVSHLGRQAKIDDCAQSWADLSSTIKNRPAPNFGCAVNANLAAMIADPADIDRPRAIDPSDAGRRQVVLEKYRAGEVTSSAADEQAKTKISQAVQ